MRKLTSLGFDLVIVAISPVLALWLRDNFTLSWQKIVAILPYTCCGLVIAAICLMIAGTHRSIWRYSSLSDFGRLAVTMMVSIAATLVLMFAVNRLEGVARSVPIIQWFFVIFAMSLARICVRWIKRSFGHKPTNLPNVSNKHDICILGAGALTELYLGSVEEVCSHGLNVVGILDESLALKGHSIRGKKILGTPAELPKILDQLHIHGIEIKDVVITSPLSSLSFQSIEAIFRLEREGRIQLDLFERRMALDKFTDSQSFVKPPTTELQNLSSNANKPAVTIAGLKPNYAFLKRCFDIIGVFLLAIIISPLILFVCLLVALDAGLPLTFWQQRPGKDGRNFRLYKFRTMSDGHDYSGRRIPDDERLTRMGLFLRTSRLDELPQLYNILIGEMSFVGPRPLLLVDQPFKMQERLQIRPGLTGWAQVQGGKILSARDKAVLDLWYIQNSNLWLDIRIVLKTVIMMIVGERFNLNAVREAYRSLGIKRQIQFPNFGDFLRESPDKTAVLEAKQRIA